MSSNNSDERNNNLWPSLFGQFNRTIHGEAEKLFQHIVDSQTNLMNEGENLRKEIDLLRKEKEEMSQLLQKYDHIVTLNVGGQLFSTTIDTLTKETCLFTKMFSGRISLPDHQGATFIDRDPTHFRYDSLQRKTTADCCFLGFYSIIYERIHLLSRNQLKSVLNFY